MKAVLVIIFAITSVLAKDSSFGINQGWSSLFRNVAGRITGGKNAFYGQHPYQVSFQIFNANKFSHYCGGSIISPTYVVTAAHCVTKLPKNITLRIVAGVLDFNDVSPYRQNIEVIQRIAHPKYVGSVAPHDVALLKLAKAVILNPVVKMIRLPKPNSQPSGVAELSGWGSISASPYPTLAQRLQTLSVPIIPYEECKAAVLALAGVNRTSLDKDANICTGPLTGGFSACAGDSGGPLAQNGVLVGIASWGMSPCGKKGAPSVFARANNYIDFIKSHVPDLPAN